MTEEANNVVAVMRAIIRTWMDGWMEVDRRAGGWIGRAVLIQSKAVWAMR
jgi:hypothetical protein